MTANKRISQRKVDVMFEVEKMFSPFETPEIISSCLNFTF